MTPQVYMRAILPIGITFSFSLIGSNRAYLYLSVAFIQMLKATTPVAVLLSGWLLGVSRPNLKVLLNVSIIAFGILLASIGEIDFVPIGVFFQLGAVVFEATRLSMVQKLLTAEFKMDPLLSIYYYSPICAVLNFIVALIWDIPKVTAAEFANVGFFNFAISGMFAFFLNLAAVSLVSLHTYNPPQLSFGRIHSSLLFFQTLTRRIDRQNFSRSSHPLRCPQRHSSRHGLHDHLGHRSNRPPSLWLLDIPLRHHLLQTRVRCRQEIVCRRW